MCNLSFLRNILKKILEVTTDHPTYVIFVAILSACGHAGLVSKGWSFFLSMEDQYGIEPRIEHYGCMVNLLGRAGHLEEAYVLVKNMNTELDPVLWGTLLAACRFHDNIALGEELQSFWLARTLQIQERIFFYQTYMQLLATGMGWQG